MFHTSRIDSVSKFEINDQKRTCLMFYFYSLIFTLIFSPSVSIYRYKDVIISLVFTNTNLILSNFLIP